MKFLIRILLFGIIIFLSVVNFGFGEQKVNPEEVMIKSLNDMDGNFLECNINFGQKIYDRFLTKDEIICLGKELLKELNIKGKKINQNCFYSEIKEDCYSVKFTEDNNSNHLIICGINRDNSPVTINISSYKDEDKGEEETNLFIDVVEKEKYSSVLEIKEEIEDIFNKYNTSADITTCIIGTFDRKLDRKEQQQKILKVLETIGAKEVENFSDNDIISITAYTSAIDKCIYTGNKRMNYNIAMRYNEYENKTYVWIGVPIIAVGY